MIINKNKKGAEKTISVYWFAILVIVAGAVIYMVSLVYGQPYDVRKIESEILASNVADCFSKGGYLNEWVLTSNFNQTFLEKCNLNLDSPDFSQSQGEYYIEASIYDFETNALIASSIKEGNPNLKIGCGAEGNKLPVCSEKSFYSIDREQKSYKINILTIVNKVEKNVQ